MFQKICTGNTNEARTKLATQILTIKVLKEKYFKIACNTIQSYPNAYIGYRVTKEDLRTDSIGAKNQMLSSNNNNIARLVREGVGRETERERTLKIQMSSFVMGK